MNAPVRLGAYGLGVLLAFGVAYAVAGRVVPDDVVDRWEQRSRSTHHAASMTASRSTTVPGVSLSDGAHHLSPVRAPTTVGTTGQLAFRVLTDDGTPLTSFRTTHEKDLHLIVVRSDGGYFRHVHPRLDPATGTWTVPWTWDAAGTYRVYADFTPGDGSDGLTLTRTVDVAGPFRPVADRPVTTHDHVDGDDLSLSGDLVAGRDSELVVTVTRDGAPVTTLQPYLGAFGHLVALRDGDLAYLHVHPREAAPADAAMSGPTIAFTAEVPTPGRYLLYLDVRIDDRVRTAEFVVDAAARDALAPAAAPAGTDTHTHSHPDEGPNGGTP